jgi:hypothetical protein
VSILFFDNEQYHIFDEHRSSWMGLLAPRPKHHGYPVELCVGFVSMHAQMRLFEHLELRGESGWVVQALWYTMLARMAVPAKAPSQNQVDGYDSCGA